MPHILAAFGPAGPLVGLEIDAPAPGTGAPDTSPRVAARLQIDTGASATAIDEGLLARIGAEPIDIAACATAAQRSVRLQVYRVRRSLGPGVSIDSRVLGVRVANQGIDGLLGRDLLSHCVMVYDGPRKHCTVSF